MEFYDARVNEIKDFVEKELKVKITHHSLTFYGICENHQAEKKSAPAIKEKK
jgi:Fe2+ or Zn2+ uptake regulation protein